MLMAEGQSIPCHKMLLASVSEYFRRKFVTEANAMENNLLEIEGITFHTLKLIVSYLYSGKININVENIKKLIAASDMLKLSSLTETCGNYAVKILNATNCLGFYEIAALYNVEHLSGMAHQIMMNKFVDVVTGPEFKALAEDEVIQYIQDEKLRVLNEDPVFEAVVLWVKHDIDTRRPCFSNLLEHVRLTYCSPSYLQNVIARESLMEHPACQKLLMLSFVHQFESEDRVGCVHDTVKPHSKPRAYYNTLLLIGKVENRRFPVSAECYFLTGREWIPMKDLSLSRCANVSEFSACLTKDGILVSGGLRQELALRECWLLSTTKFEWTTMPSLNTARYGHVSVAVGDQVYVVGGRGGNKALLTSVEHFDKYRKKWAETSALDRPLESPLIECLDQYVYVFGKATVQVVDGVPVETGLHPSQGQTYSAPGSRMYNPQRVQTQNSSWFSMFYPGSKKYEMRVTVLQKSKAYAFDTTSMKWSSLAEMPQKCTQGSAVAILKKIYVVGGAERCCMCFDPYLGQWTILSHCARQHIGAPAVVWGGRILVCGGLEGNTELSEEYDPRTNTWRVSDLTLPYTAKSQFIFAIENGAKM